MKLRKTLVAAGAASACLLAGAVSAQAAPVSAGSAKVRDCASALTSSARGVDRFSARAPYTGMVRATLKASGGDWDLGLFGSKGRSVAGSAAFASNEVASGFVRRGERLTVQACRVRGSVSSARVGISFARIAKDTTRGKVQVVDVRTRTRADKRRLQGLGLDLTEHGDANSIEVVLHGARDARELRRAGFAYTVRIADLEARTERNIRRDRRTAASAAASDLPSGRETYRRLPDYEYELKQLAMQYPALVKPITLNNKSILGRDVNGIEIATNPNNTQDGKPIFLMMGVHHAREWPSSEHTMEFAYDLLKNYGSSARTTNLVNQTRVIIVPLVNPDGFNISREAPDFPPNTEFGLFSYEMKRKNCDISQNTPAFYTTGTCDNNPAGRLRGTDPNRNYGGFWGGAGASTSWSSDTYRGDGPFSEPEIQNIHELVQSRQVTNLITNHTYSNLLLRPPGVAETGFPLEEPQYKALGKRMADHNQYSNIPSFGLYDTTGGTEDWSFWTAGGYGFTFEIGPNEFHPPYTTGVEAEYLGRAPAAGAGKGGNREAYYEMLDATADTAYHGLLTGKAPEGWTLKIRKDFNTSTSPVWNNDFGTDIGDPIVFEDFLESTYRSTGNDFAWHVNPSTRPVVAGRDGRDPVADPQGPIALANPDGQPAENTNYPGQPYESIPFTVDGPPGVDNGKFTVHIEWGNPNTDWDLYVVNADTGQVVTQSAAFGDTTEDATMYDPPAGNYVAHVVNFDQIDGQPYDDWTNGSVTFASPTPRTENEKESWTLSCIRPDGQVQTTTQVVVDRGQRVDLGRPCQRKGE